MAGAHGSLRPCWLAGSKFRSAVVQALGPAALCMRPASHNTCYCRLNTRRETSVRSVQLGLGVSFWFCQECAQSSVLHWWLTAAPLLPTRCCTAGAVLHLLVHDWPHDRHILCGAQFWSSAPGRHRLTNAACSTSCCCSFGCLVTTAARRQQHASLATTAAVVQRQHLGRLLRPTLRALMEVVCTCNTCAWDDLLLIFVAACDDILVPLVLLVSWPVTDTASDNHGLHGY